MIHCKHCDTEVITYQNCTYSGSGRYWDDGDQTDLHLYAKYNISKTVRCGDCNRKI